MMREATDNSGGVLSSNPTCNVSFATGSSEADAATSGDKKGLRLRKSKPLITRKKSVKGNTKQGEITVEYDSNKHFKVLSQLHGSVWPRVLPFCLVNMMMVFICDFWLADVFEGWGVVYTGREHRFLTMMLSFLVIRRAAMALSRYDKAGDNLSKICRHTRDLVAAIAIGTSGDQSQALKEWRNKIAYYSCLLLRLMVAASDYASDHILPWEIPELHGKIKENLMNHCQVTGYTGIWAHAVRVEKEEVYCFLLTMFQYLRLALADQSTNIKYDSTLDKINTAYCDLERHYTEPPPFPIIQMSRTILFVWVFTLPFVLMFDTSPIYIHMIGVFFITFAFIGLELVSIELDDPFGADANDFDNIPMAQIIFEDVYAIIDMVDGPEWASMVRSNMNDGTEKKDADAKDLWSPIALNESFLTKSSSKSDV